MSHRILRAVRPRHLLRAVLWAALLWRLWHIYLSAGLAAACLAFVGLVAAYMIYFTLARALLVK